MGNPMDLSSRQAAWTVVRAQGGDRQAVEELLAAIQDPLLVHIETFVGDQDEAKDALQDTLLLIVRKLKGLRDPRWFRAWAYRIASREAMRTAKKLRRKVSGEMQVFVNGFELASSRARVQDLDDPTSFAPDLVASLPHHIAQLSPAARVVVQMHYIDRMTLREIAEALELPLGTIKSRLGAGLQALRHALHHGT